MAKKPNKIHSPRGEGGANYTKRAVETYSISSSRSGAMMAGSVHPSQAQKLAYASDLLKDVKALSGYIIAKSGSARIK